MRTFVNKWAVTALAGLLATTAWCITSWGIPSRADSKSASVLEAEPRLDKVLDIETPALPLAQLVERIHKQLGVNLAVQGDLFRRPVTLQIKGKPARAVMEQLAVLFGGAWAKRDGTYYLLTDEVTARLVGRYREPAASTIREQQALIGSLTQGQGKILLNSHRLSWSQLTLRQQALFRVILTDGFLQHPEHWPSSIINGAAINGLTPAITIPYSHDDPPAPLTYYFEAPAIQDDGRIRFDDVASFIPQ